MRSGKSTSNDMEQNDRWVEDRLEKLNPESDWQSHVTTAFARFEGRRAQHRFIGPRTISAAIVAIICVVTFPQPRAVAQRVLIPCLEACQSLVMTPGDASDHLHRLMWTVHGWLGLTAPDFAATDATGANFQLSDYAGKVIVLNFWASWCAPCQKEIPWFIEFQRTYGSEGLAVIGISMDEDGWKTVRPVIAAQKINYRIALGDSALAQKYGGVESLPQTLIIRGDGIVVRKYAGITSKSDYELAIKHALGKY
jgi:thiol-disulfide isomerase/thioredoxin